MAVVVWILDLLLRLLGIALLLGFPMLRKKGNLYLEEEIGIAVWGVVGMLSYYVNVRSGHLFPAWVIYEYQVVARIGERALIVVGLGFALFLQFRANVKKTDDGPTHPKNKSYDGGGQTYLWDEDDEE